MNDLVSNTPVLHTSIGGTRTYVRIVRLERSPVSSEAITLGRVDTKGRELGQRVNITREVHAYGTEQCTSCVEQAQIDNWLGETFLVTPHTMRGGYPFGAMQPGKRVRTLEEAEALKAKNFAKARATVGKKSGVI